MDEREGKAYYLGALVLGCCYSFVLCGLLLGGYFFGNLLVLMISLVIIMTCVNLFLLIKLFKGFVK